MCHRRSRHSFVAQELEPLDPSESSFLRLDRGSRLTRGTEFASLGHQARGLHRDGRYLVLKSPLKVGIAVIHQQQLLDRRDAPGFSSPNHNDSILPVRMEKSAARTVEIRMKSKNAIVALYI